jgi:hypothetical protein
MKQKVKCECFHDLMVMALTERGEILNQGILSRYAGGQVMMSYPTGDVRVGQIDSVDIVAGTIEVACDWVAYKKKRQRVWRREDRCDDFIVVVLSKGWRKLDGAGTIEIIGSNGSMVLSTACHFVNPKDVREL